VARGYVPIAFTRIDRWLGIALFTLAALAAVILWLSSLMVSPPRPRVSASARPTLGLALKEDGATLRIVRAASPAADSGLRAGDRITAIDGKRSPTMADVASRLASAAEGQSIPIEARRGPQGAGETGVLANVTVAVRNVSPADLGLPFEDVTFRNADGLILRGWYIPPPPEGAGRAAAIAYGHGNAADRTQWLPSVTAVHDAGFAQLLFDFTGRGESDGEVITLGAHEAADLRSALDVLAARPEVDPLRLAVGGISMGAVAAISLAADDARVKALVLDSPFADLTLLANRVIGSHYVPAGLVRPILFGVAGWRAHYDPSSVRPVDAIRKVTAPILLFHGESDTVVPFADALALKSAARGPFTLVALPGLDHNSPRPGTYQEKIVLFLTRTLPPSWRSP
jgi:dipeptidyl aminopeptidase/acylaminoacyl peptidase